MAGKKDIVEQALKLVMGGGGDDTAKVALRQSAQQATDIPAHLRPGFKVEAAPGADEETRNLVDYLSQRDPSLSFDPQSLAERREDLGVTVPGFHGSPRNIERFTNQYSSPEGYWGGHHYFTTSPVDASVNYATPEGADLFRRLESSVERTLDNFHPSDVTEWYAGKYGSSEGINPVDPKIVKEYADDIARQELGITNEGAVYPVNLRMKNPVKIDSPNQTFWGYDTQYDEAGDIVSEGGPAADLFQATRDALADYNVRDREADELIGKLYERAIDYGGIDAKSYNDILRGSHMDLYDEDGNMVSMGHVMADAFRRMGHDSIDMPTDVFAGGLGRVGMAGTGGDTRHYIIFDPKNVRSRFGAFDPFKAASERISDAEGGAIESNDDIDDAIRIAKDVGGSTTPVMLEDAKGNKYDAQGKIIPPTNTGPNPQRGVDSPEAVGTRAAQDPATFDAIMERYAVPDRDIAEYEALKSTVAKQPQDVQQMTHVGDRPRRDVSVDMPLLGGEYKMGTAPYDVAGPMSGMAQTAYDWKTAPFYALPATAPFAMAADTAEGVATGDPLSASLAIGFGPGGKYAKAAGIGAVNYLMAPDEAEAGPERWFSKAMQVARELPMEKMTGQQALAMLRKGVSPEELKWTGADAFLPQQKQITKQDLVDYLAKNRVQTQDVVFGGAKPVRRGDVVPSETAIAPYKERWDELVAQNRAINEVMLLPPSERDANIDDLLAQRNDIQYEMDQIHDKAVDATIEEMGGLGLPVRYGPGSQYGEKYMTRGGEGYRETLVQLPQRDDYTQYINKMRGEAYGKIYQSIIDDGGTERLAQSLARKTSQNMGPEEIANFLGKRDEFLKVFEEQKLRDFGYKSHHWEGYPNVVAHVRSQILDVVPPGANRPYKAFNVDEAQSDWAKAGREKGFVTPEDRANYPMMSKQYDQLNAERRRLETDVRYGDDSVPEIQAASEKLAEVNRQMQDIADKMSAIRSGGIPVAPYVTGTQGWTDLSIKKALDQAMDAGADYFTYTPGEAQAKRYSLRNEVQGLAYDPEEKTLSFYPKDGRGWQDVPDTVPREDLKKYVGEEAAKKLLAQEPNALSGNHILEGIDLEFGGEGMIDYYNNIYKKRVEKVVKDATGKKVQWEVIPVQTADGPREQLGFRLTDDMKEARFSDFNKGGRVTDPIVNKALSLTAGM